MAEDKHKKHDNSKAQAPQLRKSFMKQDKSVGFSGLIETWSKEGSFSNLFFGKNYERFRVGRALFCLLFSFVFAFLLNFELNLSPSVRLGEVATQTIRAPFDFQVTDEEATSRKQKEEVEQVPVALDYYPHAYEEKLAGLRKAFFEFRLKQKDSDLSDVEFAKANRSEFEKILGVSLPESVFSWLCRKKFHSDIEELVLSQVEDWAASYLVDEAQIREGISKGYALTRIIDAAGVAQEKEQKLDLSQITPILSYENLSKNLKAPKSLTKYDVIQVSNILKAFKKPNLVLNPTVFSQRKMEAKKRAIPVVIPVKKNQVILYEGTLVQPQDLLLVNEVQKQKSSLKKKSKVFFVTLILVVFLMSGLSLLKQRFKFSIQESRQDFLVLFSISFLGMVVIKLFVFLFESALYQKFGTHIHPDVVVLLAPFAMLFMLAALLVPKKELLLLFVVYFSLGLSFLASDSFSFLIVALIGGIGSVRAFAKCRSRQDFYFAGFVSGVIIGLSALFIYGLQAESFEFKDIAYYATLFGASILGGVLSAIFTVTLVPLFESIFDVMTDLKLLELSSLSHPLIKDLMVRAPGTYHHCMVVGSMVEAACYEVGVNGLLGKVMAYFHDVGKMEHADYFIENQRKNHNPHDSISPYLSKTIIIAHVKDGVELILKHGLGKAILDGVKEHHGTTLIKYFYNKAVKQTGDSQEIKEEEFRYPGPKPQFKESAILMLADSIEAAARTIDEPSPIKIQTLIDGMVDAKFSDGQLDECSITFEELTKIKKIFYRVLVGVYHHRVEYPKEEKGSKKLSTEKPRSFDLKDAKKQ